MPSLDGLRALAVIAVVLYHLGVPHTQGGLIGVTIFFVISGYLITRLLLTEYVNTRTIDFKSFYVKRAKRLLPAIVLVIVATAALCTLFSHPLLTKMRPDVLPSLLFFNNWWQIANQASYFDNLGAPSPLTHFWSLAIEEQFYLVLPVLLFVCLRKRVRRRPMYLAVIALAAVSFAAMAVLYNPDQDPTRVYYGTDTRAFSLLIGVALAMVTFGKRGEALSPVACDALAAVGVVGLVLFAIFSNGSSPFLYRGGFVLVSLLTAAAIVGLVAPGGGVMAKILAAPPLLWVGTRSYGIYLWHYPLVLLMTPQNSASDRPWWLIVVMAVVVGVVAELSYRFVEQPIRKGTFKLWAPWARRADKGARVPQRGPRPMGSRRPDPKPSPLSQLKALHPVVTGVAVCTVVAAVGLVFVPDTSVLSKEGAALLEGSDEAVTMDSVEEAKEPLVAASSSKDDNTYLKNDTRSEAQKAFDEKLVQTPTPKGAYNVMWIGDSVSIRALPYAKKVFPDGYVDAKKSRSVDAGLEVLSQYEDQGEVGNIVVLALGNNGSLTEKEVEKAVEAVGPDRALWLVTIRGGDSNDDSVNAVIHDAAKRYENVRVIDWHAASEGHDDYFDGDGTHLSEKGAQVYTSLIADGVSVELPEKGMEFQTAEENEKTMVDNWNGPTAKDAADEFLHDFLRKLGA